MTFHLILVLANKRAFINEVTQIWKFFNPPTPSVRHSSLRPCCLKICYPLPLFVLKSFFWGIKPSTNIWVKTKKTRFFPKFHSKIVTFLHFFGFLHKKRGKWVFWPVFEVRRTQKLVQKYQIGFWFFLLLNLEVGFPPALSCQNLNFHYKYYCASYLMDD